MGKLSDYTTRLLRHPLALFGGWLATLGAVLFLVVFVADLFGFVSNPYMGIIFFLVLPGMFVFGLALIPIGLSLSRRRDRRGRSAFHWPVIDFNLPYSRHVALIVTGLTIVNIVLVSLAAYRGVEYMDSVEFCGEVCHTVMKPEFTAYQHGPHARVPCVSCHIGPGAPWFVQSKLSGTRQLFAVAFDTFPRPIPSPVENLRPARETCEQCHWPEKFTGDRIRTMREYGDDEAVTESVTTLRLHVGSGSTRLGATGIHWHMSPSTRVTYVTTDLKRQVIPFVRVEDARGRVTEYRVDGVTDAALAKGERRQMDCMDCHNRPSHRFAWTAEAAVDGALASGEVPRTLPYIRREAVAALRAAYESEDAASRGVATRLTTFYRTSLGEQYSTREGEVTRAIPAVQRLYRLNAFPTMKVGWGTYPDNIGHNVFPGCSRCHDGSHSAKDGTTIRADCELCHERE